MLFEEYTDNFARSATKRENFRSVVSPFLTLDLDRAPTKGFLGYTLAATHDTIDDSVNFFHEFRGLLEWQATPRLRLAAQDVLTVSDRAVDADRLELFEGREQFTRNVFQTEADYAAPTLTARQYYRLMTFWGTGTDTTTHTIGASAGATLATVNTVAIGYEYLLSEISGDDRVTDEEIEGHTVTASVARALTPFASVGLSGSHATRDVSPGLGQSYDRSTVALYASYVAELPTGTLSATGSVGYSFLYGDRTDAETTTFTLGVSYTTTRVAVSVVADQGYAETFATTANEGVVETLGVRASIGVRLTERITAGITGFYRENDFTGFAETGRSGTTETIGGSASLTVELLRWLAVLVEYAYTDREVDEAAIGSQPFTENRVRVAITATF